MFFLFTLVSCENSLDKIAKLSADEITADEVSDSLTVIYTDSAKVKFIIFGQQVEKYNGDKPKTIINNGLKVRFFDKKEFNTATLTSIYGEIDEKTQAIVCKYDVVFKNHEKDQTLFTEELQWDQKNGKVYTPGNVTIKQGDGYLYGKGMEANEDFSWYKIIYPTGKKAIKNDSTKTNEEL